MSEPKTLSRTEYSARNVSVAVAGRILATVMGYVSRVVFTHVLTQDYVGVNGLFTNILNVLQLSELGVSTAISYALYRPIVDGDIERQKSLMKLFNTFYRVVALLVLGLGLCITPFLDYIAKDNYDVQNLKVIFLLYLANTVLSYVLIYKKTLIDAHQMGYISTLFQTGTWFVQNLVQIIVLVVTHNFYLYLGVWIAGTVIANFLLSRKADRMYPYLRDKEVTPLPKEERKSLFKNVRAMMYHKVGNVIVNDTDNILLSSIVSLAAAGMYSCYYLIFASVNNLIVQMFQGITASVGNLGVQESDARVKKIFDAVYFMGAWVYGLASILLYQVLDVFVQISFGPEYVFVKKITLIICINFYLNGMRQATLVFRDTMGLFRYDKFKAIPEAIINLVVSIVLGMKFGVIGIFIGTLVSTVTTSLWIEPLVLYHFRLHCNVLWYFLKYILYTAVTAGAWILCDYLGGKIVGSPGLILILRSLIVLGVVDVIYLICYFRTKEFRLLARKGILILGRFLPKKTKNLPDGGQNE